MRSRVCGLWTTSNDITGLERLEDTLWSFSSNQLIGADSPSLSVYLLLFSVRHEGELDILGVLAWRRNLKTSACSLANYKQTLSDIFWNDALISRKLNERWRAAKPERLCFLRDDSNANADIILAFLCARASREEREDDGSRRSMEARSARPKTTSSPSSSHCVDELGEFMTVCKSECLWQTWADGDKKKKRVIIFTVHHSIRQKTHSFDFLSVFHLTVLVHVCVMLCVCVWGVCWWFHLGKQVNIWGCFIPY